jgi:hypothetical protein
MPVFDITAPDGKQYEIEGPNAEGALAALQQHLGPAPSTVEDVAKSGGIGLAKGAIGLAGAPGDISNLLAKGSQHATNFIADKLGIDPGPQAGGPVLPTSGGIQKAVESQTGEFYEPKTRTGKFVERAAEFLPASALGPGGMAAKLGTGASAGLASEAAGQLTEGTKAEPYARVAGALAGGLGPMAAGRAITPLPASPQRQRLVDILNDEGVTSLTAGQRTGNDALKYAESFLGDGPLAGQGASRIQRRGQEQFTEAAMRRAGAGPDAAPEVLGANQRRLGDQFRDLAARNDLTPDNQFVTDIVQAAASYRRVPDSQQRQMVQGYIDDIVDHVNAGSMPGPQYQEMRSRLSRQSNSLRQSDPTLSETLRDMRNALDNAMERSIPAGSGDAELWRQSRREYGSQKTIEKAASRAGEATAEGQIVPANLRNAIPKAGGGYARGEGDFSELARAGSGVMQPLPNSGTAQRNALTNMLMLPVSATAGRALTSRPVQGYLGNQALTEVLRNLPPARQQALIRILVDGSTRDAIAGPSN